MNRTLMLGGGAILAAIAVALLLVLDTAAPPATDDDLVHVSFATDWKAEAEHGGFYQALAKGYYREAGLDVSIKQGGPAVNVPQLLATGSVDFGIGSNAFIPLNMAVVNAGAKAVMATFQKDPQVLITHPRDDVKSIADMKGKPIMVSDATVSAFWQWLKAKYDFTDDQIRKYTFNTAPFIADEKAIQQGYLSSEPYTIEKRSGMTPQVFLLADAGYPGYASFIMAPNELIAERPEVVRAFVEASIRGWVDYLYGDPAPGNALIKRDNPDATDDLLAHSISVLKENGIVDSGETETLGIGAMTDARWRDFYTAMRDAGVYPADLDLDKAYTLAFVNKGVGLELEKKFKGE